MFQRITSILILTSITVQAVFGGLQNSVSICLGGGHEHNVAEVIEQCGKECSHQSTWPTPITSDEDIDGCACIDLELSLISLLTNIRNAHDYDLAPLFTEYYVAASLDSQHLCTLRWPPDISTFDTPPKRQQLVVVRTTRLLL
jgi:hypothetical protein